MKVNLNISVFCFTVSGESSSPGKSAERGRSEEAGERGMIERPKSESGTECRFHWLGKAE